MVLICDNDIVLKLAAFGLLQEVVEGMGSGEVFVLEAARHRLRKPGRQTRRVHTSEAIAQALTFCETATSLGEAVEEEDVAALSGAIYPDPNGQECRIDGGELLLFSRAFREPSCYLLSGDKRAFYALGKHRAIEPPAATIHESLKGRVVCLEASLELCIETVGFEAVRARVVPARECDGATRAAFGSGLLAAQPTVCAALDAYIADIEKAVGAGWLWRAQGKELSRPA